MEIEGGWVFLSREDSWKRYKEKEAFFQEKTFDSLACPFLCLQDCIVFPCELNREELGFGWISHGLVFTKHWPFTKCEYKPFLLHKELLLSVWTLPFHLLSLSSLPPPSSINWRLWSLRRCCTSDDYCLLSTLMMFLLLLPPSLSFASFPPSCPFKVPHVMVFSINRHIFLLPSLPSLSLFSLLSHPPRQQQIHCYWGSIAKRKTRITPEKQ